MRDVIQRAGLLKRAEIIMENPNRVPILEKAIEIIEYIGAHPERVTQSELQRALGISQASCYRIVATLVERNWLVKVGRRHYDISGALIAVTKKVAFRLERYRKFQPILNHLANDLGFSVKLSIRDNAEFVNVCAAKPAGEGIVFSEPGFRCPLSEVASVSTVFLAEESENRQRKLLLDSAVEFEKLQEKLVQYRRDHFCFNAGSAERNAAWHMDTLSLPVSRDGQLFGVLSLLGLPGSLADVDQKHLAERCAAAIARCAELLP